MTREPFMIFDEAVSITREQFDAALIAMQKYSPPTHIPCHPSYIKAMMQIAEPSRHALYSVGWKLGYTVNGLPA